MKPETARFIAQSNIMLGRADRMLGAGLHEDAARTVKTHQGVQSEFFRLTKNDARIDAELRRFLSRAYDYKSAADYFSGPDLAIPPTEATAAVATATRFVEQIVSLMTA